MSDFTTTSGQRPKENVAEAYGLGQLNESGDRLFEFCWENDMIVA